MEGLGMTARSEQNLYAPGVGLGLGAEGGKLGDAAEKAARSTTWPGGGKGAYGEG